MNDNQELDELTRAFTDARETVRNRLAAQVSDARGDGAVGVDLSHTIHREKFSLGSAVTSENLRGWHRGRLGIPYRVSGKGDVEREGWVVTMHGAGTAVRQRDDPASPEAPKAAIRMGGGK